MNYTARKIICHNGQEQLMLPLDIDLMHRTINIYGEIDDEMACHVCSALRALARDSDDDVTIYIQSPGGSVHAGLSIYDTCKAIRCDIITCSCGMAASMGAFLLCAAGTKGKRFCQPHAEVLIHQPLGGTQGQASDVRIYAEHIMSIRNRLNQILSECTGQFPETIERDTERDNIMDADAALAYGLIDRIGDPISDI